MSTSKQPKQRAERAKTDRSLDGERENTDAHLARSRVTVEERADEVVKAARERADEVLFMARTRADDALRTDGASQFVHDQVARERQRDGAALATERRAADAKLGEERALRQRAIVALLQGEREETDASILDERVRADDAVQSRDDILAVVSHDLRGLVSAIGLTAEALERYPRDASFPVRVDRAAARIRSQAARMGHLLGDLVDVATIETGRLSIVRRPEDPRRLMAETVEAFEAAANARGLTLEARPGAVPATAALDAGRILQVLANLVSNALKFTPNGGRVVVECDTTEGQLRYAVRDTGVGIAPENLEAVFRQFWQVDQHDRRGIGLGLYISRWIVEAHGGRLWVESRVGEGTTFFFTLPGAGGAGATPGS